jgi:hypothetical protein
METFAVIRLQQDAFSIFFGHLELPRRKFYTVIAANALIPLQGDYNH